MKTKNNYGQLYRNLFKFKNLIFHVVPSLMQGNMPIERLLVIFLYIAVNVTIFQSEKNANLIHILIRMRFSVE